MALPATDTFTAADGTALTTYSSNWTINAGAFSINTNAVHHAASGRGMAHWNADAFGDDQYSEATITVGWNYEGPAVRCAASGLTGYGVCSDASDGTYLFKFVAGTETQLGSTGTHLSTGNTFRLEASGTTITVTVNGSTYNPPGAQTDSAIESGYAGILGIDSHTGTRLDNWEGGNLSPTGTTVDLSDSPASVATAKVDPTPLRGGILILQPDGTTGKDTWMRSDQSGYGGPGEPILYVGENIFNPADIRRTLIEFDLSDLDGTETITSVTFSLWLSADYSNNNSTLHVYPLTTSWIEAQASWDIKEGSTGWPGGGGAAGDIGSSLGSRSFVAEESGGEKQWTLSATSKADLGAYGFLIKAETENNNLYEFQSSDSASAEYRPKLVIVYTVPWEVIVSPAPSTSTTSKVDPTPIRGGTLTLQPDGAAGMDTSLWSQNDANTNKGTSTSIDVGNYTSGEYNSARRGLIRFDLSSLDGTETFTSVTLNLTQIDELSVNARTLRVYRVKRAWAEGEATWNSWSTGNLWEEAGGFGDNDCEQTDIGSLAFSADEPSGLKAISLTPTNKADLDIGYGWMLKFDTEANDLYGFYSSDHTTANQRPKLVVVYTVPWGESVVVAPAPASASQVAPTVVHGSLSLASIAGSARALGADPAVVLGSTSAAPASASSAAGAANPTVAIGGESLIPAASSASAGTANPSVVHGALTLAPEASSASLRTAEPVVVLGSTVAAALAASAAVSVAGATVQVGNLVIAPGSAVAVAASIDPLVAYGSTSVTPGPLSAAANIANPSVVQGSLAISPAASGAAVSRADPTVYMPLFVGTDPVSVSGASVGPVVVLGSVTLAVAPAGAVVDVAGPIVQQGSQAVQPVPAWAPATVVAPTVYLGRTLEVIDLDVYISQVVDKDVYITQVQDLEVEL